DELVTRMVESSYFDNAIDAEALLNDGIVTQEEIYSEFGTTDPASLSATQIFAAGLVSIAELRPYINYTNVRETAKSNPDARDILVSAVTDNPSVTAADIWEHADVTMFVESVGGYSAVMRLYSPEELTAIVQAIGAGNIKAFLEDSGVIELINYKQIAKDLFALLKDKIPELKLLVRQIAQKALNILMTDVDGIYINGVRVFKNGSFDLPVIIRETLRAIPDIDSFLSLSADAIISRYEIKAVIDGKDYTLGVEFGLLGDPARLQSKLAQYRDYFVFDVSDDLDVYTKVVVPEVASHIYSKVLSTSRVPDTLKQKLLLVPTMTVEDIRNSLAGLTDEEISDLLDALENQLEEIRDRVYAEIDARISGSDAVDTAKEYADKIINAFTSVDNFNKLRSYVLKALDKVPTSLRTLSIDSFYGTEGAFALAKSFSVDLYELISKVVSIPEDIRLLFTTLEISGSVSIDAKINGLYRLEAFDSNGDKFVTYLPAGTSIDVLTGLGVISPSANGWSFGNAEKLSAMPNGDVSIYSDDAYAYVKFVADGMVIDTVRYRIGDTSVAAPAVPSKAGYSGEWSSYTLGEEWLTTVNAVYTPVPADTHTATFMADGRVVATVSFTSGDTSLEEPAVPAKPGYTGVWESYTLGTSDITINAVYTAITYTATFKADGNVVASLPFTVETTSLTPPAVPAKPGYTGVWESYTLGTADITINAVYTPNVYKIRFVAGETVVGEFNYTYGA
ncbi:MAG: hypothetical protein ACI3XQ_11610, partial [Eubacteriales bacterium]